MKLGTGPEHDLHLLDLAAVAGQDVVDPAAYDATAELGERPAEVDALAKDRPPLLERDLVGAQLLQARHGQAGVPTKADLGRRGEQRLATIDHAGRGHQLLDERRIRPVADLDDGPGVDGSSRRTDRPADDHGCREMRAGGDADQHSWFQAARLACGLVVGRQRVSVGQEPAGRGRVAADRRAKRLERHPGASGGLVEGDDLDGVLRERGEASRAVRQVRRGG